MSEVRNATLGAVDAERNYQDAEFPQVSIGDAFSLIDVYVLKGKKAFAKGDLQEVGERLVQIAALAVRGIEDNIEN